MERREGGGGAWGWAERGQFTGENSAFIIKLIELSNIRFLTRSFKDIIIKNKQVDYNSDRLSNFGR